MLASRMVGRYCIQSIPLPYVQEKPGSADGQVVPSGQQLLPAQDVATPGLKGHCTGCPMLQPNTGSTAVGAAAATATDCAGAGEKPGAGVAGICHGLDTGAGVGVGAASAGVGTKI